MKEEGVEPDMPIFDALMDIYARHGDLDHVQQLLEAVREKGFTPTASNIGWLLAAMSKNEGKVSEAAYQLVEEVRTELGVAPHLATFSMAIDALIKTHKIDEAWAVRKNMMERWHVQPDRVLNRAFLFALAAKGDVDKIDEMFHYMAAHPRTLFPHVVSVVLLLEQRFSQDPRSPRAIEVLETLQRLNVAHFISPHLVTKPVLQAIDTLMDQNNLDSARKMLCYLGRLDLPTYERLFSSCTREEHLPMLLELWTRLMRTRSLTPDNSTALAYLGALCRCNQLHASIHFLHNMVHKGLAPTVEHYNLVLEHLCQSRSWPFLRKLLGQMEKNSVSGDSFTAAARQRLYEAEERGERIFGRPPRESREHLADDAAARLKEEQARPEC
jgi:leucine-rich PPR motif-containing protein